MARISTNTETLGLGEKSSTNLEEASCKRPEILSLFFFFLKWTQVEKTTAGKNNRKKSLKLLCPSPFEQHTSNLPTAVSILQVLANDQNSLLLLSHLSSSSSESVLLQGSN